CAASQRAKRPMRRRTIPKPDAAANGRGNGVWRPPMGPRVSVLIPAFEAAATLPACLRSLARQSEPRWECVLVDDGSRDATGAVARAAAAGDDRVRVVRVPHGGIVPALAAGLAHCRAPVVARMDADDVMRRDRLAAELALLDAAPGLAAVGCH